MKSLILLGLLPFSAMAAPADYAWQWTLVTPEPAAAYQIELDPEVTSRSVDPALGDIEVFNAAGRSVPVALRPLPEVDSEHEWRPVAWYPLPATQAAVDADALRVVVERGVGAQRLRVETHVPAGTTEAASIPRDQTLLLDLRELPRAVDRLRLNWQGEDEGSVLKLAIEASGDLQIWRQLAGERTLLDLRRGETRLVQKEIDLGGAGHSWLRVRVRAEGAAATVDGVDLRTVPPPKEPARRLLSLEAPDLIIEAPKDDQASHGAWVFKLPGPLVIDEILLLPRETNAFESWRYALVPPGVDASKVVANARHEGYRLEHMGHPAESSATPVSAARYQAIRVERNSEDALPPRVTLRYRPERLVFLAQGEGPFRLAAGSHAARRKEAPVDPLLAEIRSIAGKDWEPPQVTRGEAQLVDAHAIEAPRPPIPWSRWALWGILILGAGGILLMVTSLMRGAEANSTRTDEDRKDDEGR